MQYLYKSPLNDLIRSKSQISLDCGALTSLIVPRLFEEKRRDTVFGFPWCVARGAWRVMRGARCVMRGSEFLVGILSP